MRLVVPTDFELLEALAEGGRNNAANLSYELDRDRSYINTRLPVLADYGLVTRIGPAPNSGLYEITERGERALDHRDLYERDEAAFESRLDASDSTR
jgi:hypothetical protein